MRKSVTQIQTTIRVAELSSLREAGSRVPSESPSLSGGFKRLATFHKPTSDPTLDSRDIGRTLNLAGGGWKSSRDCLPVVAPRKSLDFFSVTEIKRCGL